MKSSEWARDGGQACSDKNGHCFAKKEPKRVIASGKDREQRTDVRGQKSEVRACPPSVWRGRKSEVGLKIEDEKVRRLEEQMADGGGQK